MYYIATLIVGIVVGISFGLMFRESTIPLRTTVGVSVSGSVIALLLYFLLLDNVIAASLGLPQVLTAVVGASVSTWIFNRRRAKQTLNRDSKQKQQPNRAKTPS